LDLRCDSPPKLSAEELKEAVFPETPQLDVHESTAFSRSAAAIDRFGGVGLSFARR